MQRDWGRAQKNRRASALRPMSALEHFRRDPAHQKCYTLLI